jgi:hypothetical protein
VVIDYLIDKLFQNYATWYEEGKGQTSQEKPLVSKQAYFKVKIFRGTGNRYNDFNTNLIKSNNG